MERLKELGIVALKGFALLVVAVWFLRDPEGAIATLKGIVSGVVSLADSSADILDSVER